MKIPYVFLLPTLAIIFLVGIGPVLQSFLLSLSKFSLLNPSMSPVGFHNYISLLTDSVFWTAIQVTVFLVVGSVLLELIVGIFLALLLTNSGFRSLSLIHI